MQVYFMLESCILLFLRLLHLCCQTVTRCFCYYSVFVVCSWCGIIVDLCFNCSSFLMTLAKCTIVVSLQFLLSTVFSCIYLLIAICQSDCWSQDVHIVYAFLFCYCCRRFARCFCILFRIKNFAPHNDVECQFPAFDHSKGWHHARCCFYRYML